VAALPERNVNVDVVLEYKEPMGLKRMAGRIPLLGHLQTFRNENGFSPPRPTAPLRPRIPADVSRSLSGEVSVDVVVTIDKSGAVKNTEITKGAGTGLATLAADTAGSVPWEPARSGDRTVATNVVLHYRFNPAQ
jgi:outer membrane biosynthesis protein TonB